MVGIPGNLTAASGFARFDASHAASTRAVLLSIAEAPLSARAPSTLRPDPVGAPAVTMRWLRADAETDRMPALPHPTPSLAATNRLRLSLMEINDPVTRPCAALTKPVVRELGKGAGIDIGNGAVTVTELAVAGPAAVVTYGNVLFKSSTVEHTLVAVFGRLTLLISPTGHHRAQLC